MSGFRESLYLAILFWTLPLWLPIVWAAFAVRRWKVSLAAILWLMSLEAVAILLAMKMPYLLLRPYDE
jgi:hypothetical protein